MMMDASLARFVISSRAFMRLQSVIFNAISSPMVGVGLASQRRTLATKRTNGGKQ